MPGTRVPKTGMPALDLSDSGLSDSGLSDSGLSDSSCADATAVPPFRKRNQSAVAGRHRAGRFNGRIMSVQRAIHGWIANNICLFGASTVQSLQVASRAPPPTTADAHPEPSR
ncbi:hypothetical protein GCM10011579_087100 [Streptomyces albiflavescens]|uniref:Uncharacterized protein n=1 Tax=Streptomyces albiflavescens TaxID=1623582 RepID=A0A917YE74_9ACTN|nr:hypothetical protein GCM10011579_087100 [Streptomyces albiflavescens]